MSSNGLVLVAPPYRPPTPPLQPGWEKMVVTWNGPDGSQWTLSDPSEGIFITRGGLSGLGDTKFTHYRDESPALDGALYRGTTFKSRTLHLNLYLYHDEGTTAFVDRLDAFWDSMDPEHEGTLSVQIPGVRKLSIRARYESGAEDAPDLDPTFFGWVKYSLDLQADQPFWAGEELPKVWESEVPTDYFGLDDDVYYISTGSSVEEAQIVNPGNRPAWPEWTFVGPLPFGSVSIDGHLIEMPFDIADGEWIKVYPDPARQQVLDQDGVSRFSEMGELDWAALPPKSTTPVTIDIGDGTGRIEMRFTPLYRRAL